MYASMYGGEKTGISVLSNSYLQYSIRKLRIHLLYKVTGNLCINFVGSKSNL
jgi:hypothetical protein